MKSITQIGMDVHKNSFTVCCFDLESEQVKLTTLPFQGDKAVFFELRTLGFELHALALSCEAKRLPVKPTVP